MKTSAMQETGRFREEKCPTPALTKDGVDLDKPITPDISTI